LNLPVASNRKTSPEPFSQRFTARWIERRDIARGRSGTPEERRPVVVERGERCGNLQRVSVDLRKPGQMTVRLPHKAGDTVAVDKPAEG